MTHSVDTVLRQCRHTRDKRRRLETETRDGDTDKTREREKDKRAPFRGKNREGMPSGQGVLALEKGRPLASSPFRKPSKRERSACRDFSKGVHVFADGACDPNPGPGAWAFVVFEDGQEIHSASGSALATTNNRMEMSAVLAALEWISENRPTLKAELHSDSQYTVRGCNEWRQGWKRKGWRRGEADIPNADLWRLLDTALLAFPLRLNWVRGHSGIAGNERADRLAFKALDALKTGRRKAAA